MRAMFAMVAMTAKNVVRGVGNRLFASFSSTTLPCKGERGIRRGLCHATFLVLPIVTFMLVVKPGFVYGALAVLLVF